MTPSLIAAGAALLAYMLGSLSGSLLLGKFRGVDIRTMGSGNAGGTNAFRTQGLKFALGVVAIDIGKGALAAWLGLYAADIASPQAPAISSKIPYVVAFAAVVGHIWPLWHGFRGGKGGATVVGATLVLWPVAVPVAISVWLCVLVLSGYVGISTILAGASLVVFASAVQAPTPRLLFALGVALLLLFTHRSNLARLRAGTESRFEKARLLHRWSRRT